MGKRSDVTVRSTGEARFKYYLVGPWTYSIVSNSKNLTPNRKCHWTCLDLIESDCIAHTERDNCSRPIKSRTDEERDLVAVVEVARDRRVDPDRTLL